MSDIHETAFECKMCKRPMKFHITSEESFISKTEQKSFFGLQLVTYRVFHDIENERHHNAVIVDHKGFFCGYVDAYKEDLSDLEITKKKTYWLISEEERIFQSHSLFDTLIFFDREDRWILPVFYPSNLLPLKVIEATEKKLVEARKTYSVLPEKMTFDIADKFFNLWLMDDQVILGALKDQSASQAVEELFKVILKYKFGYKRGLPKLNPFVTVLKMIEDNTDEIKQETFMRLLTDDLLHAPIEIPYKDHLKAIVEELKHEFSLPEELFISLLSGKTTVLELLGKGYMKDIQELLSLVDFGKKLTEVKIDSIIITSSNVESVVREILIRYKVIPELNKGVDPKKIASKIFDKEFKKKDPDVTRRTVQELKTILLLDNYNDKLKKSIEELVKHLQDKALKSAKKVKKAIF